MSEAASLLSVRGLNAWYGESHILHGVDFEVRQGEVVTLLGRNGAGKTTTLRSIMGLTPPRAGAVRFKGRDITGRAPHQVFRLGVGYVPEGRQIFPNLTTRENLVATAADRRRVREHGFDRADDEIVRVPVPEMLEHQRTGAFAEHGWDRKFLTAAVAIGATPRRLMPSG